MSARGLPVLTYHAFDRSGSVVATDPAWLGETLCVLEDAGLHAVDLVDWIARGRPDEPRGFAITIDDGLRSVLDVAGIIARHHVPATVFLVTDHIGRTNDWPGQPGWVPRQPMLSWPEIEALGALGFRFAAHGRTHAALDRCDDVRIESELKRSRDAIEDRLGRPCRLLAYPYGRTSSRVERAARRWFAAAFGTRLDVASGAQSLHHLSRIDACYVRGHRPLNRLASGRRGGWLRIRRALRETRQTLSISR